MPDAETSYLFRHALLRDAAYELQPPRERSRLHALAFRVAEHVLGGPPPPAPWCLLLLIREQHPGRL